MDLPADISSEQREKIQKTAMHKLVPQCIRYFTKIPLTVAGKIYLSRFPTQALEYATTRFDATQGPTLAFKDFVSIALMYCQQHYREINTESSKLLTNLFNIKPSDPMVRNTSSRPECQPWKEGTRTEVLEPIYISYFKLRDHLNTKKLILSNPFQGRYEEYLKEALESVDIARDEIERELYQMYLKQKDENEVRNKRETGTSSQASVHNSHFEARL